MIPARIQGCTRVLGAPPDWTPETSGPCCGLPIRDQVDGNVPSMTSCWEPTPAELEALKSGGKVYLCVVGHIYPPVMVFVLGAISDD